MKIVPLLPNIPESPWKGLIHLVYRPILPYLVSISTVEFALAA